MKFTSFLCCMLLLSSCGSLKETSTEPSKDATLFRWDFTQRKKYVYTYHQEVESSNMMAKTSPEMSARLTGDGNLNVRVKSDDFADLSITDLSLTMITLFEEGAEKDTSTSQAQPMVVQDMNTDGSFDEPNSNLLFDIVLPLPTQALKLGESEKIPLKMPYNANGSVLFIKGFNTITFTGYETMENRECAVLKGVIDISKLEIPEELKGEYFGAVTGAATYYFDVKNQCYVGADIQMLMEVMMDSEDTDEFGMYMNMKSDNVFKIRLNRIEDLEATESEGTNFTRKASKIDQTVLGMGKHGIDFKYVIRSSELNISDEKATELKSIMRTTILDVGARLRVMEDCLLNKEATEKMILDELAKATNLSKKEMKGIEIELQIPQLLKDEMIERHEFVKDIESF